MSASVPVCSGKCRKGAPDPACPLHGKGGKAAADLAERYSMTCDEARAAILRSAGWTPR